MTDCFDVEPERLVRLGVLNPTLAIDTKLFIDPLLLRQSTHSEINSKAVTEYRQHFEQVISFLSYSQCHDDVAWRTAIRAINELKPVLGLELTATPFTGTTTQNRQYFRNVVYGYSLGQAMSESFSMSLKLLRLRNWRWKE